MIDEYTAELSVIRCDIAISGNIISAKKRFGIYQVAFYLQFGTISLQFVIFIDFLPIKCYTLIIVIVYKKTFLFAEFIVYLLLIF